jgi:hypothetical protein
MSSEEKLTLHEQLEALQVKDWKELSLQEKKAGGCLPKTFCYLFRAERVLLLGLFCFALHVIWHQSTDHFFLLYFDSLLRRFWTSWASRTDQPTWRRPQNLLVDCGTD